MVKICKKNNEEDKCYAVKIMRVPDEEYFNIALNEYKMLEYLGEGHENVIKVFDIFLNSMHEKIYMVMEYAGQGFNLTHLIEKFSEID